ncbi:4-coumarate--CoA ligase 5-like [Gigantopelta aegis]|uniref:4-coumarate--CoA ligase 5-like n=1 Tax=Gigantopelta aegis TaxID=1735272 RepID=UPI001B88CE56|nr:4-coumarate--CoA ligase 5-like [Gigantopelta aegis]
MGKIDSASLAHFPIRDKADNLRHKPVIHLILKPYIAINRDYPVRRKVFEQAFCGTIMRLSATRLVSQCLQSLKSGRSLSSSSRTQLQHVLRRGGNGIQSARAMSSLITPDNILKSPFPDETIPDVSLTEYLFSCFKEHADKTAIVDFPTGRSYSYSQLKALVIRVASALNKRGFKKGDVIAVFSPNLPEYSILIMAAATLGVVLSPANPLYTPPELARHLQLSGSKALVSIELLLPTITAVFDIHPETKEQIKEVFVFGEADNCVPFSLLMQDDGKAFPENVDINPSEDTLVLPFSSGTTGLPKGVMLTHRNCVANLKQIKSPMEVVDDDVLLGILPFYHIYGMVPVQFGALQIGSTLITLPRFDPEMFINSIYKSKVSVLHIVPPIILFLLKFPSITKEQLKSVRYIISGAAPLGEALTKEFTEKFDIPIYQGYGLTESSPVICADSPPGIPGTIGHCISNTEAKIKCVDTGKTLGVGEFGEFCARGPQMMKGYLNDPEATSKMLDKDGWLQTGDLGYYNENGTVVIEDRLKELIKYKGYQVPPAELENLLLTHPAVQDCAVIGIPDVEAGELPRAYVVLKEDTKLHEIDVIQFVQDHVSPYKRLRGGVEFVDEIPKSVSGKILRRVLKAQILSRP